MAYLTQFGTATTSNTNLNTTTLVGTFTNTTRIRKLYLNIFADQVKGNGDYKASITVQRAGAGSFYQSIITTNAAASGVTSILFNSIAVTLNATDVMKVYLLGLSTDNDTTADVIVDVNEEWVNVDTSGNVVLSATQAAYAPAKAGDAMLITAGTGAGQLDITSGVVKANLAQILGTALTETAGQISAAFKKFFDKATPTGTINSLPDAVPSASGGLPIVDAYDNLNYGMFVTGYKRFTAPERYYFFGGTLPAGQSGLTTITPGGAGWSTTVGMILFFYNNVDAYRIIAAPTDITVTLDKALNASDDVSPYILLPDSSALDNVTHAAVQADATAALTAQGYTAARSVYLDTINTNLDAKVSTRATPDQVWDEAIAGHLNLGSTGLALNTAGASTDPLLNPVPGTYAAGTAGAALGSITTGKITVTSPMSQDGLAVKLVRGDDYLNADGRALVWTDSGSQWPNLTGATVKFKWVTFSKSCTVIGAGGAHQQVSLDLTGAETDVMQNGYFDLEATLSNTHVVTIVVAGSLIIRDDV